MALNVFRALGDGLHLLAMVLLLAGLLYRKNARTVSLRTQELYLVVYITRYTDLLSSLYNTYNTTFKILFLSLTLANIYVIRFPLKSTITSVESNRWYWLVPTCFVMGLIFNYEFTAFEIFWAMSQFLEAIAMLPQVLIIRKLDGGDDFVVAFALFMGIYRLLYCVNWVYRHYSESHFDWISVVSGVTQVILFFSAVGITVYKRHHKTDVVYEDGEIILVRYAEADRQGDAERVSVAYSQVRAEDNEHDTELLSDDSDDETLMDRLDTPPVEIQGPERK